jgi:DNA-binding transcriptional LysR family regulator
LLRYAQQKAENAMDLVRAMQAYVRVVEAGSFIRAADQLDTSNAAVTRQVAALERHLGSRLLNRTTRRQSLTDTGQAFLERARQILADIADAEAQAASQAVKPTGVLRISAPLSFGVMHLSRLLPAFRQRYPQLRLDVDLSDRVVDLANEGVDVAVRIASDPGETLVARRIAPVRMVLCASPMYLQAHGAPAHPSELGDHETMSYTYLASGEEWPFTRGRETVRAKIHPSVRATNGEILRELALAGGGIVLQPSFIVGAELMRGTLVQLLREWQAPELSLYAVYLSRRQLSAKVRVFIDYLIESVGGEAPYWEAWQMSVRKAPAKSAARRRSPSR